jgi:hypothetical protein
MAKTTIQLSQDSLDAVAKRVHTEDGADAPLPEGIQTGPDGTYTVDLDDDIIARLERYRRPGESLDSVLRRVVSKDIIFEGEHHRPGIKRR